MKKLLALVAILSLAIIPTGINQATQQTAFYCLRQFEWVEHGPQPPDPEEPRIMAWVAPDVDTMLGLIDLRTLPQMGTDGPTRAGQTIIAYSVEPALSGGDLGCFGSDLNRTLTLSERTAFEQTLNLTTGDVKSGETLTDAIYNSLTTHSDPTGQTAPRPIGMGADGKLKVYLGGKTPIKEESFVLGVHPHTGKLVARLQEDYRKVREGTLAGYYPPGKYLQYLDYLTDQYRTDNWRQFVPSDLPYELPIQHATTITEDWNCTDTSVGDIDCDLTWTHFTPDTGTVWRILTNEADCVTGSNNTFYARADTSLSTDEHSAQVDARDLGGTGRVAGIFTRKAAGDTDRTFYRAWGTFTDTDIDKIVTDTITNLAGNAAEDFNEPDVWRLESDGSDNHELFDDETSIIGPTTDSTITGNLRVGIGCFAGNLATIQLDDFIGADLGAPPVRRVFKFWPF